MTLRQPVDREQRELYRLTIRLSDTLHTTDISQILLVGFSYFGLDAILVSNQFRCGIDSWRQCFRVKEFKIPELSSLYDYKLCIGEGHSF